MVSWPDGDVDPIGDWVIFLGVNGGNSSILLVLLFFFVATEQDDWPSGDLGLKRASSRPSTEELGV